MAFLDGLFFLLASEQRNILKLFLLLMVYELVISCTDNKTFAIDAVFSLPLLRYFPEGRLKLISMSMDHLLEVGLQVADHVVAELAEKFVLADVWLRPDEGVDVLEVGEDVLAGGGVGRGLGVLVGDGVVDLPRVCYVLQTHRIQILHEERVHPLQLQRVVDVAFGLLVEGRSLVVAGLGRRGVLHKGARLDVAGVYERQLHLLSLLRLDFLDTLHVKVVETFGHLGLF